MKNFRISYIIIAMAILFPIVARYYQFSFFDEQDGRLLLTGLALGLFIKVIKLQNKTGKIDNL